MTTAEERKRNKNEGKEADKAAARKVYTVSIHIHFKLFWGNSRITMTLTFVDTKLPLYHVIINEGHQNSAAHINIIDRIDADGDGLKI